MLLVERYTQKLKESVKERKKKVALIVDYMIEATKETVTDDERKNLEVTVKTWDDDLLEQTLSKCGITFVPWFLKGII